MMNLIGTDGNTQKKKKKNGEPQRSSWEHRRRRRMANLRDMAGDAEENVEEWWTPEIQLETQKKKKMMMMMKKKKKKKNGEPWRFGWGRRRRRRKMMPYSSEAHLDWLSRGTYSRTFGAWKNPQQN